jgi:hypothetical protein
LESLHPQQPHPAAQAEPEGEHREVRPEQEQEQCQGARVGPGDRTVDREPDEDGHHRLTDLVEDEQSSSRDGGTGDPQDHSPGQLCGRGGGVDPQGP